MAERVVFVEGVRTPFGRMGGSLKDFTAVDVAALAIRGLLEKTQIQERKKVDCVFLGSAIGDVKSYGPARFSALAAGLPADTSASYVEMQCGSAIDAINHAAWKIMAGCADIIIAGGMESHSQSYAKFSMAVQPYKKLPPMPVPQQGSPIKEDCIPMLEVSDRMAKEWGISRLECDEFALRSQMRTKAAMDKGFFKHEIVPVTIPGGKKTPPRVFDTDEHPRPNSSLEGLAALEPVRPGGVTTAGNASGLNDGAAMVLMMSESCASRLGYRPYAAWVTGADCGTDPKSLIGPAYSNLTAMKRAGLTMEDISVFECNEAFAAQNLSVIREMEKLSQKKIDQALWNPNGGAIAFGHPNGASGGRIAIFTMHELERSGGRYGMFSSCCGGGMGVTTIIENLRR